MVRGFCSTCGKQVPLLEDAEFENIENHYLFEIAHVIELPSLEENDTNKPLFILRYE